jgi:hypothetical protein
MENGQLKTMNAVIGNVVLTAQGLKVPDLSDIDNE